MSSLLRSPRSQPRTIIVHFILGFQACFHKICNYAQHICSKQSAKTDMSNSIKGSILRPLNRRTNKQNRYIMAKNRNNSKRQNTAWLVCFIRCCIIQQWLKAFTYQMHGCRPRRTAEGALAAYAAGSDYRF